MNEPMDLDYLKSNYIPGSRDEDWTWADEAHYLWLTQGEYMLKLLVDIAENGIHDPICLGPDGRIWDGHHRITIATALGLDRVPVE
ncbi:ParB-like nuclease domain protein [Gordonia phage Mollymur]|uniref:ParB-like nuclease domain protein n=1 Tax=Gordonia phage Mollymur TaxID=2590895 RepID=A0A4Y6EJ74_9CAUD|nr:ParB-like nuclease domain protein [Gordonia phage Mollymur]QDF15364.1 ParB-like nuclease domain protein [Gordonia phage Mollymur]